MSYDYSYDNNGNITEIKQNGKLTNKYVYDSLNELKEEYDYVNKFYINYSYDGAGNLQNKYEQVLDPTGTQHGNTYEYTDTSWKDKLTKINGDNITYDANGNPLTYRDGMSFEWENGRILKKINTSDKSVQMSYDSNGMRTQKTVDGVKTNYYYDSNKNLIALVKGNDTLLFYYDSDGSATSFSYNGTMYFYVKNLQGDVVRIIDLSGTEVASYVYDAWGNIKDTKGEPTIREINPIRYRGYVYDDETGLYYLQSRYYDPVTGRFINADVYCDTNTDIFGTNMFTYCNNDPINQIDPEGTDAKWVQFSEGAGGWGHTSLLLQDDSNNWWYFYWGPKHAILRPCGKDDFTIAELNSYLTGFDPRAKHNYYVYAINVFSDVEDINRGGDYALKLNDGLVTGGIVFSGNYSGSYEYAVNLLCDLYINSDANQFFKAFMENNKKVLMYDIATKYIESVNQYVPDNISIIGYHYIDINANGKCNSYDLISYNCVEASIDVLTHSGVKHQDDSLRLIFAAIAVSNLTGLIKPNKVYEKLKNITL